MVLPDSSGLTGSFGDGQSGGFNFPTVTLPSSSSSGAGWQNQLNTAATAASGTFAGGFLGSAASGAGLGASIGSIIPGLGTVAGGAAGAIIGAIGSLFGGGGAPDHERGDLNIIARDNDITADQASWVCGYEESKSPRNYDDIVKQAAGDKAYFQSLVVKYNASGTSTPVRTRTAVATEAAGPQYAALQQQAMQMFAGTGSASPFANMSFNQAVSNAKAQDMTLSDYLTAILNGALSGLKTGIAGAAADTPAGQAATNDTLAYLAKKYQLLIAAFLAALIWLVVKAFDKK